MLINELKAMAIFAEVIKQGSFRKAAKALSLSPSVVSYHISQLEDKTGAALIYRSTRRLTLSHEGNIFYAKVQQMLEAASQGIELLSNQQSAPRGKLKISLPTALSRSLINNKVADFAAKYPNINLCIDYSDTQSNIIQQGTDLTIRASKLDDSNFRARKIGHLHRTLVCSPTFFCNYPPPQSPQDLSAWQWIKLEQLTNERAFLSSGRRQTVKFNSQISVNSVEAIYQFCLKGMGLAVLATSQVREDIGAEKLVEVLPQWQVEPLPLYAVWPNNIQPQSNVKALLAFLG